MPGHARSLDNNLLTLISIFDCISPSLASLFLQSHSFDIPTTNNITLATYLTIPFTTTTPPPTTPTANMKFFGAALIAATAAMALAVPATKRECGDALVPCPVGLVTSAVAAAVDVDVDVNVDVNADINVDVVAIVNVIVDVTTIAVDVNADIQADLDLIGMPQHHHNPPKL
jgi:hypothetical protein